jgi:hypothetical protein
VRHFQQQPRIRGHCQCQWQRNSHGALGLPSNVPDPEDPGPGLPQLWCLPVQARCTCGPWPRRSLTAADGRGPEPFCNLNGNLSGLRVGFCQWGLPSPWAAYRGLQAGPGSPRDGRLRTRTAPGEMGLDSEGNWGVFRRRIRPRVSVPPLVRRRAGARACI